MSKGFLAPPSGLRCDGYQMASHTLFVCWRLTQAHTICTTQKGHLQLWEASIWESLRGKQDLQSDTWSVSRMGLWLQWWQWARQLPQPQQTEQQGHSNQLFGF